METRPAGAAILSQDTIPDRVHLLFDGIVRLERARPERPPTIVGLRFPGWFLGAESVIAQKRTPVSVVAVTDCTVRGLARERFLGLVRVDPDLSWRISQMHSRELLDELERVGERAHASPAARLKWLLVRLMHVNEATQMQKRLSLRLPFDLRVLAELVQVSVPHLARLFQQLQQDGLITLRQDRLTVLHPLRLSGTDPARADVGWPVSVP